MKGGLVKYDKWEDVIWSYNNVHSPLRTPLTGALIGTTANDQSVKYVNYIGLNFGYISGQVSGEVNMFCGCHNHTLNNLAIYSNGLVGSKSNGIYFFSRTGDVNLKILNYNAEEQIFSHSNHITCGIVECDTSNPRISIATMSNHLYLVNGLVGNVEGTVIFDDNVAFNSHEVNHITALSDFIGNTSSSSCVSSYCQLLPHNFGYDYDPYASYQYNIPNQDFHLGNGGSSMADIAKRFGNVESIPEFVPKSMSHKHQTGPRVVMQKNDINKTIGALTLECCLKETNFPNKIYHGDHRELVCIGMSSGALHILDHRINQVVATMETHSKAIHSISASGNTIVTSSCSYYSGGLAFEPLIGIHDLRMKKSTSQWLGGAVSKVLLVPQSDRLFAMLPDGAYFDFKLSTNDYTRAPAADDSWCFYGMDAVVSKDKKECHLYRVDCGYTIHTLTLPNHVEDYLSFDPDSLPSKYKRIPNNKVTNFSTIPFGSILETYTGDFVQVIIQVFFFLDLLDSLRYHVCKAEHCITCQVGFALHQLRIAHKNRKEHTVNSEDMENNKGSHKHFEVIQIAQLQELVPMEDETNAKSCQQLLLWLLEKMNSELENYYSNTKTQYQEHGRFIKSIFGFSKRVESTCTRGHTKVTILDSDYCISYENFLNHENGVDENDNAYCLDCHSSSSMSFKTEYLSSPNVLLISCNRSSITNVSEKVEFRNESYRISSIIFSVPSGVCNFRLMAYCRIPSSSSSMECDVDWVLINEGIVIPLSKSEIEEIFDFSCAWKEPIFLVYTKEELKTMLGLEPTFLNEMSHVDDNGRIVPLPMPTNDRPIPASIFTGEHNIAHNPKAHDKHHTFMPLSITELVSMENGDFIMALDVECVQEHTVVGKQSYRTSIEDKFLRQSEGLSLGMDSFRSHVQACEKGVQTIARISALRASGPYAGVPFLDHYIHRKRPPKDYLTRFSGIRQGDLDLKNSVHWLTTRKLIYMKIRYLVDAGCKIVGHGLEQDFKMLNVVVPLNQIIDTVELYRMPGRRYISLQFLAQHVLHRKIQGKEHDSVEDAKTALDLYSIYLYHNEKNQVQDVIEHVYNIGYRSNWVVN
ncbi:bifunctional Exonuclease [Babesia duncani]|uniref:Bifunctional Exonuclease n=1 Tax=Babesia duncani TaxID=323732 RepID=A0AAD9PLS6_9APIC|nr:bifunctional Exonuclease [Babesia duncani]